MGMGAATAELFAQAGARVVVADFDDDAGRDVVADIQRAGGTAHFHQVDVSDSTQVRGLIAATAAQYGRLDVGRQQRRHPTGQQAAGLTTAA